MKKLLCLILIISLFSCKKENSLKENSNPLMGTKWTGPDALAHIFYGGVCTTSVEFLTETTCQEIDNYNTYTNVDQGTYKHWADSVSWTIKTTTIKGRISGSLILSDVYDLGTTNRIYTKQ